MDGDYGEGGRAAEEMPPDLGKRMRQAAVARALRVVLIIFGAVTLAGQVLDPFFGERVGAVGALLLLVLVYALSHGEDDVRARARKFQPSPHNLPR